MSAWQPINTCPEKTWVLLYAEWETEPKIGIGWFQYRATSEWETVMERTDATGARRQTRQEIISKSRAWLGYIGDWWMPLPEPPK